MTAAESFGYEAEPEEAAALAASEITPILEGWPGDPLPRAAALTSRLVTWQAAVDLIAAERARAVAEMHAAGMSYAQIAAALGMSRGRAQQLAEAGRSAGHREAP